ncbi:MAG: heat-inducible transcription repressor HrcA [Clostridiales bacterium]|nr:heat-inducible transcription repressor HrcA [Clostridiales bacterium]
MDISDRKKKILKAIVESYINTVEPVGSKAIALETELGLSSATIRNEMAELTKMGYLEQPHTSAGRVPSPQGYRIYVNELMRWHKLSVEETEEINKVLRLKIAELDALISDVGRLIAELTNYPAYTMTATTHRATIRRFDFIYVDQNTVIVVAMLDNNTVKNRLMQFPSGIEESFVRKLSTVFNSMFTGLTESEIDSVLISAAERSVSDKSGIVAAVAGFAIGSLSQFVPQKAYLSGSSHILDHPEYRDIDKAQRLLTYLSDDDELLKLPVPEEEDGLRITIGPENLAEQLRDSSVVVASYDLGNEMQGLLGVVGPTRMDYAKVAARLGYISRALKYIFLGGNIPPPQISESSSGKD